MLLNENNDQTVMFLGQEEDDDNNNFYNKVDLTENLTPLNYQGFEENLVSSYKTHLRLHYMFGFKNKYRVSVVKGYGTYGGASDLFELALIRNFRVVQEPIGWLNNEQVLKLLQEVKDFVPINKVDKDGFIIAEKLRLVINKG